MFLWNILGESFFKVTPAYNSRGLPSGGLQKLLPPDAYGSGSRPHPGTAGPQATAYAVDTLADDSKSYSPSYIRLRLPLPHLPNTAKEAASYAMGTLSDDILSGM